MAHKAMLHKAMPNSAVVAPSGARGTTLPQLARSGVYQFLGSRGEKITMIDKEKLRSATAGVPSKGKK